MINRNSSDELCREYSSQFRRFRTYDRPPEQCRSPEICRTVGGGGGGVIFGITAQQILEISTASIYVSFTIENGWQ